MYLAGAIEVVLAAGLIFNSTYHLRRQFWRSTF